ncbi:Vanillyl-alcohol oxidase [Pseudocercospora fuligena]|uniref:Vanillyl-alcohol oxidase n=1 Tax=Pseudocercospora fuligena TaxID=685502 RepID=A0A8H6RVA0_9PEZI|nr:Vanillyl-alcohol oxidase [Pseudocercospora fuligena]
MDTSTVGPIRYTDPEYQQAHNELFLGRPRGPVKHVLPPGVSQKTFEDAISQLVATVGAEHIFTSDALSDYIDPYATVHEQSTIPSAAVCPANAEELRSILAVANQYRIPLWTFSRGKNLGYGGPSPRVSGSIALDLHRMNKVLEVNEKFAYAVVEPGVTFQDLYKECVRQKLNVWPSTASLGWGSVIGNTLDRGQGFVPTANHFEHVSGMEVMLADGSIVRTGQWAKTNSASAHLSKFTFGPGIDSLFFQSNLGIVIKMGIGLTPAPEAILSCSFWMPDQEDIDVITDVFGDLRRRAILPSTYVFNIVEWSSIFGKRHEWWSGSGPIPSWRLKEIQKQLDTGHWTVRFNFYGPPAINQVQYDEVVKTVLKRVPGTESRFKSQMFSSSDGGALEAATVPMPFGGMFVGVPTLWSLPLVKFVLPKSGGVGAHGAYSTIIPLDGAVMREWVVTARKIYEDQGLDAMCDFFMHEKHAVFVCMLVFDKTNPEHCAAIDRIFFKLFEEGKKRGFSKYRAHVNHMDMVAEQNDFNGFAYRKFVERLKDAVDPNGILSPGKSGIWPQSYRHLRETTEKVHDAYGFKPAARL